MPPRTLVVVNPRSRSGAGARRFRALEPRVREVLAGCEIEWTRGPRDAERLAREGVRAGVERIVVAGGDGTTSEVASGLLAAGLGRSAELGLLPLGTGGDLARTLGVARDPERALAAIAAGKARPLDAGRVRCLGPDGRERTLHFVNVASFGASGRVTELVNATPKALGGRLSFLVGTLRGLARHRSHPVEIVADGEPLHSGPLALGAVANGRFFGAGMHIAPRADPADGLLDVVAVPGFSRARLLRDLPRIYAGTHLEVEGVRQARARRVTARAEPGAVPLECDGEPLGSLPADFEVLPGALSLVGAGG